jgi:hypothetical protein
LDNFTSNPTKETTMLLKAEDDATFRSSITQKDVEVWACYSGEGRVNGEPVRQADKRMFASEQEARSWLVGEAELRGFGIVEPELHWRAGTSRLPDTELLVLNVYGLFVFVDAWEKPDLNFAVILARSSLWALSQASQQNWWSKYLLRTSPNGPQQ